MTEVIIKCGDCWAHYPIGNLHICDPLMKALVTRKRMIDDNAAMMNNSIIFTVTAKKENYGNM